jgi:DNA-binding MarR family transcriptional regulator
MNYNLTTNEAVLLSIIMEKGDGVRFRDLKKFNDKVVSETLQHLEQKRYIKKSKGQSRPLYYITDEGAQVFKTQGQYLVSRDVLLKNAEEQIDSEELKGVIGTVEGKWLWVPLEVWNLIEQVAKSKKVPKWKVTTAAIKTALAKEWLTCCAWKENNLFIGQFTCILS